MAPDADGISSKYHSVFYYYLILMYFTMNSIVQWSSNFICYDICSSSIYTSLHFI